MKPCLLATAFQICVSFLNSSLSQGTERRWQAGTRLHVRPSSGKQGAALSPRHRGEAGQGRRAARGAWLRKGPSPLWTPMPGRPAFCAAEHGAWSQPWRSNRKTLSRKEGGGWGRRNRTDAPCPRAGQDFARFLLFFFFFNCFPEISFANHFLHHVFHQERNLICPPCLWNKLHKTAAALTQQDAVTQALASSFALKESLQSPPPS